MRSKNCEAELVYNITKYILGWGAPPVHPSLGHVFFPPPGHCRLPLPLTGSGPSTTACLILLIRAGAPSTAWGVSRKLWRLQGHFQSSLDKKPTPGCAHAPALVSSMRQVVALRQRHQLRKMKHGLGEGREGGKHSTGGMHMQHPKGGQPGNGKGVNGRWRHRCCALALPPGATTPVAPPKGRAW